MSEQVTCRVFPPDGSVFGPGAFAASIGGPAKLHGQDGILRGADVADGGACAVVTIEFPGTGKQPEPGCYP